MAISGTSGPDRRVGTAESELIWGGGGNDTLLGMGGDDILIGGAGADRLEGGEGSDTASYRSADAGVIVNLDDPGEADAEVHDGQGDVLMPSDAYGDRYESIENVQGSRFKDDITGDDGDNALRGGRGNDDIAGDRGDDTLKGGAGHDDLMGDGGDDMLRGGSGNDELWGGAGKDTLKGGAGDDVLCGDAMDDMLYGGRGDDMLYGGDGNDMLFGDAGDDVLHGGDGNDELTGGQGDDVFVVSDGLMPDNLPTGGNWTRTYDEDTINDFEAGAGNDQIQVADSWLAGMSEVQTTAIVTWLTAAGGATLAGTAFTKADDNGDFLISDGNNTLRLDDIGLTDLVLDNFVL
jgi:Ca2+-binding RTX toxin-like protein